MADSGEPPPLVLVKVGGSALTDKSGVEVLRMPELRETARQVDHAPFSPLAAFGSPSATHDVCCCTDRAQCLQTCMRACR